MAKKQPVEIRGNTHGILVILDGAMQFDELKEAVKKKFIDSAKFLSNGKTAICFEGRTINREEEEELLTIITENTSLDIVCIIEKDEEQDAKYQKAIGDKLMELSSSTGQFYKGNLRSGQILQTETSLIIIGDVNPGSNIISKGNVIILGACKGNVWAGAAGNEHAFIMALEMSPIQIKIADVIARAPDKPLKDELKEAKIAFLEEGSIYIDAVSKKVLHDIQL